jgi:hypothetical protein
MLKRQIDRLKQIISARKVKRLWKNPDIWFVSLLLRDDRVFARVKNNMAKIESVPKPSTGLYFEDVVYIEKPVGKYMYRDEEIDEFKTKGIHSRSGYKTFQFEAFLPNSREYFHLQDVFSKHNLKVRFPWIPDDEAPTWLKGYCAAETIMEAKKILQEFVKMNPGSRYKSIIDCDTNRRSWKGWIKNEDW